MSTVEGAIGGARVGSVRVIGCLRSGEGNGAEPGDISPRTSSKSPLPASASRASRRDLQRPGGKSAPERIDEARIQKIGAVAQPLREIGLSPGGRAARLRA